MDPLPKREKTYEGKADKHDDFLVPVQSCPVCTAIMGALPGTRDAICGNCGYKDPCCE